MLCNVTTLLISRYCHSFTELSQKVKISLFRVPVPLTI